MKCRNDRLIWCIIAIFILFSGMCVELPQAGSLLGCIENHTDVSCIVSPKGALSYYELSSMELLESQNTSFIVDIEKRPVIRTFYRVCLTLCLAGILLFRLSDLEMATETVCAPKTHYFDVLLNYIHSQDGKK